MKKLICIFVAIFCAFFAVNAFAEDMTKDQVTDLVEKTCIDMTKDAKGTIEKINNAEAPYQDAKMKDLYVFIYNTSITVVAHPQKQIVGKNYKGKPDVRGKNFRDEIINEALSKGTGWVDYSYQKPGATGIFQKTTYYKLITGSDGEKYIVCSGKYL